MNKFFLPLFVLPWIAAAGETKLTVNAGAHDRSGSIISFTASQELRTTALLKAEDGTTVPVQIDEAGHAFFIEPQLAAGKTKTYTPAKGEVVEAIHAAKTGDLVEFTSMGKPLFSYQTEPGPVPDGVSPVFSHGAHLHPIYSPGGKLVTGNHPPDHRWHRGIWFAWTETDFEGRKPDFWNMGKGAGADKSGEKLLAEVRFAALDKMWGGPVQGGFQSQHRFIDHTGETAKDALTETWDVTAYRIKADGREANVIDLVSTQNCAGSSPLKLPKYFYGGLGVRGNRLWDPVDAVNMLTSNGDTRLKGDSTKGKWVYLGGDVDGGPTGIAVLIHPANFRFPQPLRLNPKNPQLCIAPSQDGDWSIEPGKPYVSRYRIVIADGAPDAAWIEKLWQDYAEPATAEVTN